MCAIALLLQINMRFCSAAAAAAAASLHARTGPASTAYGLSTSYEVSYFVPRINKQKVLSTLVECDRLRRV